MPSIFVPIQHALARHAWQQTRSDECDHRAGARSVIRECVCVHAGVGTGGIQGPRWSA